MIEVRGIAGTRAWNRRPANSIISTTGELGGLWRHRGKPPNEIVGIGFTAMGYDAPRPATVASPAASIRAPPSSSKASAPTR